LIATDAQWDRDWIANGLENCARERMVPATVGVFIEPGQDKPGNYSNRSFEYDALTPRYTEFLLSEILPQVEKLVKLSHDPAKRALTGMSSGGICSFTACWERPDQFGAALSFIGSFANIASGASKREGGHNYPFLIRKTEKKPIRVYLQDGSNDLNNDHGSWWICNLQMESALRYKGYDVVWNPGNGFHSTKHARRIFDQALKWWIGHP
jgi:enterochelin esterase family protein